MSTEYGIAGKKYLVTGASSGIGQATAIAISKLGGRLVLSARNEERLNQTYLKLEGEGHFIVPHDLTELDGIKSFVRKCVAVDGQAFDGLVFSGGAGKLQPIRAITLSDILHVMHLNFCAYALMLKEFSSRRVLNNGGSIVALSSRAAAYPGKSNGAYAGSKSAMDAISEVAAQEFVSRQIRVNTIRPENTDTPLAARFFSTISPEAKKELYPLGALVTDDLCDLITFLLGDLSKKITGQHIYISAGNFGSSIDYLI